MRQFRLYQVDAFTREKFAGNPAGVIPNADGLTDEEMQKIARELNNSETAFVFRPDQDGGDVHVRFFTPTREVPLCGHATIAAHYVRALENNLGTVRVFQKTGVGVLPVDIVRTAEDYEIEMTQGAIEFGTVLEGDVLDALLLGLGITPADLSGGGPVQIVSTGYSKVMVGIWDKAKLHALKPDMERLVSVSHAIGCNGFYVFTMEAPESGALVHGRMFAPASGIPEDPVTGNANGPLGAYLVRYGLVKPEGDVFTFCALQGEAMKRAGAVCVRVKIADNEPSEVSVSGSAVVVFKTELVLE